MAAVLETSKAEFGSSGGGAEDDEEFKKVVQMSIADSGEYHPPTYPPVTDQLATDSSLLRLPATCATNR